MRVARHCPSLPCIHIEISVAVSESVFTRIALRRNCIFYECGQVIAVERAAYGRVAAWNRSICNMSPKHNIT